MSNPEATPNRRKESQDEKFYIKGDEFIQLKPFSFGNLIKEKACDDYDSILIAFARKFGVDKNVPVEKLIKFLDDEGIDDWDENISWLVKRKFVKEVVPGQRFIYGTKFWDNKREVMLIELEDGFALVDLKTGKTPYGEGEGGSKNFVTRKHLWEYLDGFEEEEFEEFIKTNH